VQEIRKYTGSSSWRYVNGDANPADMPSGGCKSRQFIKSRWWEGALWMKSLIKQWPCSFSCPNTNNEEIESKRRKTSLLANTDVILKKDWYYRYFSKYENIVRLLGWILRFKHNCFSKDFKILGELRAQEYLRQKEE